MPFVSAKTKPTVCHHASCKLQCQVFLIFYFYFFLFFIFYFFYFTAEQMCGNSCFAYCCISSDDKEPVKKGRKVMFLDGLLADKTSQIRLVGFQGIQQRKLNKYHQKNIAVCA